MNATQELKRFAGPEVVVAWSIGRRRYEYPVSQQAAAAVAYDRSRSPRKQWLGECASKREVCRRLRAIGPARDGLCDGAVELEMA